MVINTNRIVIISLRLIGLLIAAAISLYGAAVAATFCGIRLRWVSYDSRSGVAIRSNWFVENKCVATPLFGSMIAGEVDRRNGTSPESNLVTNWQGSSVKNSIEDREMVYELNIGWPFFMLTGSLVADIREDRELSMFKKFSEIILNKNVIIYDYSTAQIFDHPRRGYVLPVMRDHLLVFKNGNEIAAMPSRIIVSGMIANALVISAPVVVVFLAARLLCRWRRFRQGLCRQCCYSLEGISNAHCPECGHNN